MPVNTYEFLILLDSGKVAGDFDATREQLHGYFTKVGGEILISRVWDDRRLAYQIGTQKKGLYYLIYAKIESTKVIEIEGELRLNESIIRHMPIKLHPKWSDTMLTVSRDERHGVAFHAMTDDETGETRTERDPVGAGVGDDEGGPPRRGPRRPAADIGDKD